MARGWGTTNSGGTFDRIAIQQVWEKGMMLPKRDANEWRADACGNVIRRADYGKETEYGWEIDHVKPVAAGGTDDPHNLQPLYWETNRSKSDTYPWECP